MNKISILIEIVIFIPLNCLSIRFSLFLSNKLASAMDAFNLPFLDYIARSCSDMLLQNKLIVLVVVSIRILLVLLRRKVSIQ